MADAFFEVEADAGGQVEVGVEHFLPTEHARGPWDPAACHAGPPTGLLARAAERAAPGKRLTRLTVDLMRPIPMAGFRIYTSVTREGRAATTTAMTLVGDDGRAGALASGLLLRLVDPANSVTADLSHDAAAPSLDDTQPGQFPIRKLGHGLPGFNGAVTVRYPPGEGPDVGPTTLWMSTLSLLADEEPSPFQRICPLADCGNAFSRYAQPWEVGFVNADLSIWLHREPRGEWLGMRSTSNWHADGTGLADSVLFDEHGTVGRAMQSLLITPPPAQREL